MSDSRIRRLRQDCTTSLEGLGLERSLAGRRIAVVGGTGFVGSWVAETVATLNDEFDARIRLDLLGQRASQWLAARPHMKRPDIAEHVVDVRSPFELRSDTTHVLHAAGIADPTVHASDAHRMFRTIVNGTDNALTASLRLERIERFLLLSSGLVAGTDLPQRALGEGDIRPLDFTRFHSAYAEARRASESLASIHASQYRTPVSTARPFTFLGPWQPLEAPWALNNFIRDALTSSTIRVDGDGATRRSHLYGSDVAAWLLQALAKGTDGAVYNIGGAEPASHSHVATCVAECMVTKPRIIYKARPAAVGRNHDFHPDTSHTRATLGVRQTVGIEEMIRRSLTWHADLLGVGRRLA